MNKRFAILLTIVAIMLTMAGCNNGKNELRQIIAEINSECPIDLGAMGTMDKVDYTGNAVTISYTVSDGSVNFESIKANEEAFHNYMLDNYCKNNDESFRQLLKAISDAGADLNIVFFNENGESLVLNFTNDELTNNVPDYCNDPEKYLESVIDITRLQLPITFSEGIVCTSVDMDDHFFSYYLNCDEKIHNIAEMQQSVVENRDAMVEMITSSSDPSFIHMTDMLKSSNRGLQYVYIGSVSGKEAVVTIKPEEL